MSSIRRRGEVSKRFWKEMEFAWSHLKLRRLRPKKNLCDRVIWEHLRLHKVARCSLVDATACARARENSVTHHHVVLEAQKKIFSEVLREFSRTAWKDKGGSHSSTPTGDVWLRNHRRRRATQHIAVIASVGSSPPPARVRVPLDVICKAPVSEQPQHKGRIHEPLRNRRASAWMAQGC